MMNAYDVVLMGPCGLLNLAANVSADAVLELQTEAKKAVAYLNEDVQTGGGRDSFDAVFTTKLHFWQYYDQYVLIKAPEISDTPSAGEADAVCDMTWTQYLQRRASLIAARSLVETGRATAARAIVLHGASKSTECSWRVTGKRPDDAKARPHYILVGLFLDPAKAFSLVVRGPEGSDKEACRAFRSFWGSKSELRRFKEFGIIEAVVWDTPGKVITDDVPCRMLSYLFSIHTPFKLSGAPATLVGNHLQSILDFDLGRNYVRMTRGAVEAFGKLSKKLYDMKELPLRIMSVEASDARLRYSSVEPIAQHPLCFAENDPGRSAFTYEEDYASLLIPAAGVVMRFERSGRWPDDIEAIKAMKTAFYVKIAELLEASSDITCKPAKGCLDILSGGYAFRIRIRHDREYEMGLGLVAGHANFSGSAHAKATQSIASSVHGKRSNSHENGNQLAGFGADAISEYVQVVRRPLLHQRLHALHMSAGASASVMSMSRVVRLAKMWFSGHNFSPFVSEEAVELLVASLYLHPKPFTTPKTALSGFMRFLHLMGHWDWENSPLIVNLGEGMTEMDYAAAFEAFSKRRDNGGGVAMCILTPEDKTHPSKKAHKQWEPTWGSPSASVLARMGQVARDSLLLINHLCASTSISVVGDKRSTRDDDEGDLWKAVFKSTISGAEYDAVIRLDAASIAPERSLVRKRGKASNASGSKSKTNPQGSKWLEQIFKNLWKVYQKKAMCCFDPAERFLSALKEHYGHVVDVYANSLEPTTIGIRWKPGVLEPVRFRVAVAGSSKPVADDGTEKVQGGRDYSNVALNVDEVLADMKALGAGLVKTVELTTTAAASS